MKRRILAAISAAALAAVLAAGCSGNGDQAASGGGDATAAKGREAPPVPGVVFPGFERFKSAPLVGGGEFTLQSVKGKVVLLDLFGTWCPPCRKSIPVIVSLYERFHAAGLEVVGLAYEQTKNVDEAREAVEAFRGEFKIPYVLAIGPQEVWTELQEKAHAEGAVPTILLLDRQGVVRDMFQGLEPGEEKTLADHIEKLLEQPAVAGPPGQPG
jgi:thiol-disulfide isomerase/thioredoxin